MPHGTETSQPAARRPTTLCRWGLAATLMAPAPAALAQSGPPDRIPLVTGLVLGSVLHAPIGEREDLLEIGSADSTGVHYAWHERTIIDGDTSTGFRRRFVSANDLAGAPRFDDVFGKDEQVRPGFTAVSLSSAVYRQLRDAGSTPFSMMVYRQPPAPKSADTPSLGAFFGPQRSRYKGTLTRVSTSPEPFPLLLNGSRATVPALRIRGTFAEGMRRTEWDVWIQADSAHPLLLKSVLEETVFQMVRADLPVIQTARPGTTADGGMLAEELKARCRVELPGVYFAFGTATIDPISDRALAQLARSLVGHPEWKFTVEGHTDSVGTDEANRSLSLRRAEAVRARLAEQHGVNTRAWGAMGYGATRPKESNATIEGRARNRRVELVRDCR